MLTPQEVSSKTFPKAVMGGYAMTSVDDFLDQLTEDYENLYKDNAALKAKIKLLAEKMEEQRKSEDAFRALLLSAQKMSEEMIANAESKCDEIVKEAESHRDAIMGDAEAAARRRIEELRAEVKAEEQRLADKKKEVDEAVAAEEYRLEQIRGAVASFVTMAKSTCQEQLELLAQLEFAMPPAPAVSEEPAQEVAPAEEPLPEEEDFSSFFPSVAAQDYADSSEEEEDAEEEEDEDEEEGGASKFFTAVVPSLSGLKGMLKRKIRDEEEEEYEEEDEEEEEEEESAPVDDVQGDIASVMRQFAEEDQATLFTSEPEDETRVINLDDLQFGRNYTADE